jgi:hypothetical protein
MSAKANPSQEIRWLENNDTIALVMVGIKQDARKTNFHQLLKQKQEYCH